MRNKRMRSRCTAKDVYFMAKFFQVQLPGFTLISVYGMIFLQTFSFIHSCFVFFFRNSISFFSEALFFKLFYNTRMKGTKGENCGFMYQEICTLNLCVFISMRRSIGTCIIRIFFFENKIQY